MTRPRLAPAAGVIDLTYTGGMSFALKKVLTKGESRLFTRLNSPTKIQDFLNSLPFNHEYDGETYMSVRRVIESKTAHCFEGALFAAAALMYNGQRPLLLDLQADKSDQDHVVTLFRSGKFWGALSKTNHGVLRYREPIYGSVRELALSYFHEYFLQKNGKKTLRAYSDPFDLSKQKSTDWLIGSEDLIDLVNELEDSPHHRIVTPAQIRTLRKADAIEIKMADHVEWFKKR